MNLPEIIKPVISTTGAWTYAPGSLAHVSTLHQPFCTFLTAPRSSSLDKGLKEFREGRNQHGLEKEGRMWRIGETRPGPRGTKGGRAGEARRGQEQGCPHCCTGTGVSTACPGQWGLPANTAKQPLLLYLVHSSVFHTQVSEIWIQKS